MTIRRVVAAASVACCVVLACWLVYDGTQSVSVRPDIVRVELPASGDEKPEFGGLVEVVNSTHTTVRLLGVSPSCPSCISVGEWDREIGPRQSAKIRWRVTRSFESDQKLWVFTDARSAPVLVQLIRPTSD